MKLWLTAAAAMMEMIEMLAEKVDSNFVVMLMAVNAENAGVNGAADGE